MQNIPDILNTRLKPIYQGGFLEKPSQAEAQFELAKKSIYLAQEKLFIYKHENKGELPTAILQNLLMDEPNRNSRHVIIAISGWLS